MWERAGLKYYAKEQLRQYYWVAFAVCLVGGLLGGSGAGGGGSSASGSANVGNVAADMDPAIFAIFMLIMLVIVALGTAFSIFVGNPISVGVSTFFIAAPRGYRDFDLLFYAFRGGRYLATVKTMFLTKLYIFLWGLLLWVPGIVKSYQYRMVPYLISDHPYLTPHEAMEISKAMTDGDKWEMFVLDLSFIGWYLLGMMALFVGMLFVTPYVEATWAQLYYVQRQRVNVPPPPMQRY